MLKSNRILTIQGLRAFAVIGVLLFHAKVSWVKGGFLGVDAFFVVSGFVISRLLNKELAVNNFSFLNFYSRRAWRLMPALGVMLLVTSLIFCLLTPLSENKTLFHSLLSSAFGVSNFIFLGELDYFDSGITNPVLHTWSLAVEEQFYLIFPAFLYFIFTIKPLKGEYKKRNLFIFIAIVGLIIATWKTIDNQSSAFFLPWYRFWEFTVGVAVSYVRIDLISKRLATGCSYLGINLLVFCMLFYQEKFIFPGVGALIPVTATALIILGSKSINKINGLLSSKPVVFLGDLSYSLYLVHWPIVCFIGLFLSLNNYKTQLIIIILSFVCAYVLWRFVEVKFRNGIKFIDTNVGFYLPFFLISSSAFVVFLSTLVTDLHWDNHLGAKKEFEVKAKNHYLFRDGDCFLISESNISELKESICLNVNSNKENVLVIGDSLAANIVLALQAKWPEKNILQATAINFVPGNKMEWTPAALQLNQLIDRRYLNAESKIKTVILASRWRESSIEPMLEYVSELKKKGIKVIVFGPFPEFYLGVPAIRAQSKIFGYDFSQHLVKKERFNFDEIFKHKASIADKYVSSVNILCPSNKCDLRINNQLIYTDKVHLTSYGAAYLVSKAFSE